MPVDEAHVKFRAVDRSRDRPNFAAVLSKDLDGARSEHPVTPQHTNELLDLDGLADALVRAEPHEFISLFGSHPRGQSHDGQMRMLGVAT